MNTSTSSARAPIRAVLAALALGGVSIAAARAWQPASGLAAVSTQVDVSQAPNCGGALRDLSYIVSDGVRASGWMGLTPVVSTTPDGMPIRYFTSDIRLRHRAGAVTTVRCLTPISADSLVAAIDTTVTLADFADTENDSVLWFKIRVAPQEGRTWAQIDDLNQIDVVLVPAD